MAKKKQKRKPDPPRFLLLAQTASGSWPHPVEVSLHPAGADSIVGFSIGPHAANVGGRVPLSSVLDGTGTGLNPNFAEEFDAAELHWLVPFLVRLHAGEDVEADIESAYRERHGTWPASRP
ncbi:hypothetical protein [Glycomyces harbinensis]|uniref:Uncharacterized protein n=1 Tax=Glycomyces harbinensis TaxID=58114 RepID=A0A1G6Y5Q3_9ACTN|nr:hypothetical protein [Glycomyces harbinensis]SDD85728.1 hypothetical protein SAMN05216270_108151 [Glycomyces harbinensis]